MKIVLLTFILVTLYIGNSFSQKPVYEWIRTAQGTSWDEASAVACDNDGNSILMDHLILVIRLLIVEFIVTYFS